MSWAAHNPEKWQEVCVAGVTRKIEETLKQLGFDEFDRETVGIVAQALADEYPQFTELVCWAGQEVSDAHGSVLVHD